MTNGSGLTLQEEKAAYQAALKQCQPGQVVVGCDEYGHAVTLSNVKSSSAADGKKTSGRNQNLLEILNSMLNASSIIYTMAVIRKLAKNHAVSDPGCCFGTIGRVEKLELVQTELILPKQTKTKTTKELLASSSSSSNNNSNKVRYLKKDVGAAAIRQFVYANLDALDSISDSKINTDSDDAWNIFRAMDYFDDKNAFFAEFDDEFCHKECVYAITVNREEKRITVVFRGSVTGGQDWSTNFNTWLSPMDVPAVVQESSSFDHDKETIRVHRGFKSYLLDETLPGDASRPRQKYDDVMDDLHRLYAKREFRNYELYITGHSLGGALATLLGFKIAGSKKHSFVPKPVNVVSFAAPKVGDDAFKNAFRVLEKKSLLHAVRVSNQGDLIPVAPPGAWPFLHGFTQTGINFHLKPGNKRMEVGYRNIKSFASQTSISASKNHTLTEYRKRLYHPDNVDFFMKHTVDGLYQKVASKQRALPKES